MCGVIPRESEAILVHVSSAHSAEDVIGIVAAVEIVEAVRTVVAVAIAEDVDALSHAEAVAEAPRAMADINAAIRAGKATDMGTRLHADHN